MSGNLRCHGKGRDLGFRMNTIVAYRHAESLFTPSAQWNALAGGIPFRETSWLQSWWNQFSSHGDFLFITVLDENDAICGILPLQRRGARGWQTIAGGAICTDHVSLMVRPENRESVAEAIVDFLIENAIDPQVGWDRLLLEGSAAGDPAMQVLIEELQRRGSTIRLTTRTNLWFVPCRDDWETHLLSCSRRTRRRFRAFLKRIGDSGRVGAPAELHVRMPENEAEVIEAIEKLIELHQRRWQSQGQPGSYADPAMKEFVLAAAIDAFHRDRLLLPMLVRWGEKTQTEQIIAVQLYFVGGDQRLYCYSTGMDYDHAALSPGSLLNAFVLKYAHDNGCPGIDFMRGDEEYKKRLGGESIPILCAEVFAPTLRGHAQTRIHDGLFHAKQFVRQRRGRRLVQSLSLNEAFDPKFRAFLPTDNEPPEQQDDAAEHDEDDDLPVILPISIAMSNTERASIHSLER